MLSTGPQNKVTYKRTVTPAKAGVQNPFRRLDSGFRRNDKRGISDTLLRGAVLRLRQCLPAAKRTGGSHVALQLVIALVSALLISPALPAAEVSPGYSLHFNFIDSEQSAGQTVELASRAAARVVSLVPPAHVWEDPPGQRALDRAVATAKQLGLHIILSRMDATQSNGTPWLYEYALNQPGQLPGGSPSAQWFCATVGNHRFERWQRQETLYYAKRYGRVRHLAGVAVGGMVEPFVSQRGSLLQWDQCNELYEIAQYTPEALGEWHRWLRKHFKSSGAVNRAYRTRFAGITQVPMPQNADDPRFGRPREAFFDLAQSMNDWFLQQYRENERLWHQRSSKPFLLQISGFASEKIAKGRPEFAAFDLPAWISEADAVGMSLYTNAGYEDWGHAADVASLQMLADAAESGKQTFIMESGCEAPQVTLNPHELSFATRVGLLIHPAFYVYEYFRYNRDGLVDPGMMVTPEGVPNQPGFAGVTDEMQGLTALAHSTSLPCFVYLSAPLTARRSELAGRLNRAVYQLAGHTPCRLLPWRRFGKIPPGMVVLLPPGLQQVLPGEQLRAFLHTAKRRNWRLVSDGPTCAALNRLQRLLGAQPLALDQLLAASNVLDEAEMLEEELSTVAEFQQRIAEQPLDPRPGLSWLHNGRLLRLWVEDGQPVVCHLDALRQQRIEEIWCSTRSGRPAELVIESELQAEVKRCRSVPCRQWRALKEILAGETITGFP
jgi:hypothetical protein